MGDWLMADSEKGINSEGNEADVEDVEDFDSEEGKQGHYKFGKDVRSLLQTRMSRQLPVTDSPYANLPASKKRLVKALKKVQYECAKLEAQFYKEVHQLECKYGALYAPLYEKRQQIISGKIEPTDEECDFPSDVETDDELPEEVNVKLNISATADAHTSNVKGIPGFWLTAFKNVDLLADMIQPHDEPILQYLCDVKVNLFESNPMGFSLEFHFEPNEYFNNEVLTKRYEMKCVVEERDPFSFDGPEIFKCQGCKIDWKSGKDVTVKTVTKKQKHKNSGSVRTIKKTVVTDSFFNFFNPPIINDDQSSQELDDVTPDLLAADFELGHFMRERFVPRAVLFYTGEAQDLDDDLDCEGEEEEYLGEEEEEGEEEEKE